MFQSTCGIHVSGGHGPFQCVCRCSCPGGRKGRGRTRGKKLKVFRFQTVTWHRRLFQGSSRFLHPSLNPRHWPFHNNHHQKLHLEIFFFFIALLCDCLEWQLCCHSVPHTRRDLIRVIEGFELAQLGPALMGSPCVLLNSLALFFVPGQEGVATNEVGGCRLSQQREGEREPPRGGGTQRKESGHIWWRHTHVWTCLFSCLPFLTWSFKKGVVATKDVSLARRENRKDTHLMPN